VTDTLVVDASAMVDLLLGGSSTNSVARRLSGHELHAPAHFDAEVLSALGRLHRSSALTAAQVSTRIDRLASAPIARHPLPKMLDGAWQKRDNLRLVYALYVELAEQLDTFVATTDAGLARASTRAELVER
jgi:predicted nucleic acid-binding protein